MSLSHINLLLILTSDKVKYIQPVFLFEYYFILLCDFFSQIAAICNFRREIAHALSSSIACLMQILTKQSDLTNYYRYATLSDPEIRPILVGSGRCTIRRVTNENQKKLNRSIYRYFLKTYKSWIDYSAPTKIGLSANMDGSSIISLTKCFILQNGC